MTTLQQLLQIPSVKDVSTADNPFGCGPADALAYVLQLAESKGFRTANVDGYAGHVEYGDGEEYVAVLCHLDVVPAGTDWTYPPFGAEIHDGNIYARGAVDDKGPAMSALWALFALKELGIRPSRKIRLIFGLDEESEWQCVEYYFKHEPKPIGGFTPDADFPLIYAEKGVAKLKLTFGTDGDVMSPAVICFEGGHRVNMIPDYAYAVVDCFSETAAADWEQKLYKEARQRQVEVDMSVNGSRLQLVVHGISGHGSVPDRGVNAIVRLASLLTTQPVANVSMWRVIAGLDPFGHGLGLDSRDDITGDLTCNVGRGQFVDDSYEFMCDIRYPINQSGDEVLARCREYLSDKWSVSLEDNIAPLYVPVDSQVVQVLLKVYNETTEDTLGPMAIGGATYARAIPNAVAFGPVFPGQPDVAHQRDENWALEDYFRCTEIYAQAMLELANTL